MPVPRSQLREPLWTLHATVRPPARPHPYLVGRRQLCLQLLSGQAVPVLLQLQLALQLRQRLGGGLAGSAGIAQRLLCPRQLVLQGAVLLAQLLDGL
mgnify:CR=1 FL=1